MWGHITDLRTWGHSLIRPEMGTVLAVDMAAGSEALCLNNGGVLMYKGHQNFSDRLTAGRLNRFSMSDITALLAVYHILLQCKVPLKYNFEWPFT